MKNILRATIVAAAIIGASSLVLLSGPANAFEVPFDWSCNSQGTSCRAPGLQPQKQKFPSAFFQKYGYPKQIVVENKADFDAVNSGWTSDGDCKARLADRDYPDVAVAKAKFCLFHQKGYNAPKPKLLKAW